MSTVKSATELVAKIRGLGFREVIDLLTNESLSFSVWNLSGKFYGYTTPHPIQRSDNYEMPWGESPNDFKASKLEVGTTFYRGGHVEMLVVFNSFKRGRGANPSKHEFICVNL